MSVGILRNPLVLVFWNIGGPAKKASTATATATAEHLNRIGYADAARPKFSNNHFMFAP